MADETQHLVYLTRQEMADLRMLVSIAAWVRSEQVAHPQTIRLLKSGQMDATVPAIRLDTTDLVVGRAQLDLLAAQGWFKRLTEWVSPNGEVPPIPSWWGK